jgi:restriction system protein
MTSITVHSTNPDNIAVGSLNAKWSARGDRILRHYIDVRHKKLNLHKEVSAPELFILQSKMDALMASWDEKYEAFTKKQNVLSGHAAAEDLTAESIAKLDGLALILAHTLKVDDRVDWEFLKDKTKYDFPKSFPEAKPSSSPEKKPEYVEPKVGFFDLILGKKAKILAAAENDHHAATRSWEDRDHKRQSSHSKAVAAWEQRQKAFWDEHLDKKAAFEQEQAASHAEVERLRADRKR